MIKETKNETSLNYYKVEKCKNIKLKKGKKVYFVL